MSDQTVETPEVTDYTKYTGQKVVIVRDRGGDSKAEEVEGTVDAGNEFGIAFKAKGSTKLEIIERAEIIEINFVPDGKKLTRRALKPVAYGQARAHLLERHGLTLAEVNALTEEQAFDQHEALDHEAADLGHKHEAKESAPAVKAADAA